MNTPNKKEFLKLIDAYLSGTADAKQSAVVEQYFDLFSTGEDILDTLDRKQIKVVHDRLKLGIDARIEHKERSKSFSPWKYASIAAAVLLISTVGFYFYRLDKQLKSISKKAVVLADIAPGGNKAILTLANGSKVSITDAKTGTVASQFGVDIDKTKDGNLVYSNTGIAGKHIAYNSIETPKGGQYQLTLPDGTRVWLNAASSLRYPLAFPGNERRVELSGEAYFEVAKNRSKPFKVYTDRQSVEVLGTHFNINAYTDEFSTRTSLLEGSVKVSNLKSGKGGIIKPGQQSIINSNPNVTVKNIDVDEAVAWKNGYFMFDEEPLESILRKVSRWYDVEIQYDDENTNKKIYLNGTLSKYSNVSKVLKKLELTGAVHFRIEGRKIIVLQ